MIALALAVGSAHAHKDEVRFVSNDVRRSAANRAQDAKALKKLGVVPAKHMAEVDYLSISAGLEAMVEATGEGDEEPEF